MFSGCMSEAKVIAVPADTEKGDKLYVKRKHFRGT